MEYLKKQTRAHKYLCCLTPTEIRHILEPYIPKLHHPSIDVKHIRVYPELEDERLEKNVKIIHSAKQELERELQRKFPKERMNMFPHVVQMFR